MTRIDFDQDTAVYCNARLCAQGHSQAYQQVTRPSSFVNSSVQSGMH